MVRCLLDMVIHQTAQVVHQQAQSSKALNVVFCGDFMGSPCVRELVTREWLERDVILAMFTSQVVRSNCETLFDDKSEFKAIDYTVNSFCKLFSLSLA